VVFQGNSEQSGEVGYFTLFDSAQKMEERGGTIGGMGLCRFAPGVLGYSVVGFFLAGDCGSISLTQSQKS
jgi:hypothetical protein